MSYILDALKKSQQERELGTVPTLEAGELFTEDRQPRPHQPWGLLAVVLAVLALLVALYAAWRAPVPMSGGRIAERPVEEPAAVKPGDAERPSALAGGGGSRDLPAAAATAPLVEPPPPHPAALRPTPVAPSDTASGVGHGARSRNSMQPRTEVAGIRLGADDLDANGNLDPELEWRLRQQLAAESAAGLPVAGPGSVAGPTPVPLDLVRDVENFKQQVRREQGIAPPPSNRPAKSVLKGDLTRLRLTPAQQAELPAYLMTAHVYVERSAGRFIVINTLRYREGEQTREGFWVERIIPQGAVLSYRGAAFFVAR